MDRALASAIAHRWHPVAAPVSDDALHRLLTRLGPVERVLDLGCGFGEWLLAVLEAAPGAQGVGVDTSRPALEEAHRRATARGLTDRLVLEGTDAADYEGSGFDAVSASGRRTPSAASPARSTPCGRTCAPAAGCCSARASGTASRRRRR